MRLAQLLKRWFSLEGTVGRKEYLLTGVGLMVLKYAVEALTIRFAVGKSYSVFDFLNPLLSARSHFTAEAPGWLGLAWVVWTIPFVWIAVMMSVRRAIDAGASPWAALLVLVPVLNFIAMLYMACIPSGSALREYEGYRRKERISTDMPDTGHAQNVHGVHASLVGIAVGFGYMFLVSLLTIFVFDSYGAALFYGIPLVAGAATAYTYNRWSPQSMARTVGLSVMTAFFFSLGFLLIGVEGFVCVAMAAPIVIPVGILGALVGRAIAVAQRTELKPNDKGLLGCLLVIPVLAAVEPHFLPSTEFVVASVVNIDAPPDRVWQCVLDFPEITEQPEWLFRLGIAYPERARIDGEGVGAVRHCEFTTGEFVEPITFWDPPRQLAFDVTEQPDPMFELSPYRHLHPPHLDGGFRSTRGEFRLVALPDGRTRLEGRTWYQLQFHPHSYWTLWADWLVHRIHLRVLRHIERLAEAG